MSEISSDMQTVRKRLGRKISVACESINDTRKLMIGSNSALRIMQVWMPRRRVLVALLFMSKKEKTAMALIPRVPSWLSRAGVVRSQKMNVADISFGRC